MKHTRIRITALGLALCTAAVVLSVGGASAASGCAPAAHVGGDWPIYGQSYANARSQPAEKTISPTTVATLEPAWTFSPGNVGGKGQLQSTPVIGGGCVYVTTSSGYIYALNADTGELQWGDRYAVTVQGVCCGGTLFAPAYHEGVLYMNVSSNPATGGAGPHVLALNAATGAVIWRSLPVSTEPGAYTNSSAVWYEGMIWIGISGPEQAPNRVGGFAFLDANTGEILVRTRTIPDDQAAKGYGGGSIWTTAAFDPTNDTGYAGTGQPSAWAGNESERVNAIVKFDADRTSPTFGQILDSMKGTWDDAPYIDVDFAGSPTLYKDALGETMVAEFQKSGWLHAGYTRHMTAGWSRPVAPFGTALGNYSSTATDGKNIFVHGFLPGQLWSVNGTTGIPNWVVPVPTTLAANPVTYTNGVVYLPDGKGVLNAFDATTGATLLARPMSADTPAACGNSGGGLSIARNTVYSVCGDKGVQFSIGPTDAASGWLIAYRLAA